MICMVIEVYYRKEIGVNNGSDGDNINGEWGFYSLVCRCFIFW